MKVFLLMSVVFFGVRAFSSVDVESVYTSVLSSDCVTVASSELETDPEIDYYDAECSALGGYQVFVRGGDIRYSLELSYNGVQIPLPRPASFHDLGASKIEWRYERQYSEHNSGIVYTALIYRLNYESYDAQKEEFVSTDELVVVRLKGEKSCVIGQIEEQEKMNVLARALADDKNAQCVGQ